MSLSAFEINCALRAQDGCDHPFVISSSITYYTLRDTIGKKLNKRTEQIQIQYRLDTDKAKTHSISIQSFEEFNFFINRMRPLIVPQRLANGKTSTRALRPVMVYFEDASEQPVPKVNVEKKKATVACALYSKFGALAYFPLGTAITAGHQVRLANRKSLIQYLTTGS